MNTHPPKYGGILCIPSGKAGHPYACDALLTDADK